MDDPADDAAIVHALRSGVDHRVRNDLNHVMADDNARDTRVALLADPAAVEAKMQKAWEQGVSPWSA
jgi:hypothetical protein